MLSARLWLAGSGAALVSRRDTLLMKSPEYQEKLFLRHYVTFRLRWQGVAFACQTSRKPASSTLWQLGLGSGG